nr:MAG TPA: hypothetical protein [Caudoviricetes sp.]
MLRIRANHSLSTPPEDIWRTWRKPTALKAIFSVCALNHSGGEIGAEKQNPRCRDLILPAKPTSRVIA